MNVPYIIYLPRFTLKISKNNWKTYVNIPYFECLGQKHPICLSFTLPSVRKDFLNRHREGQGQGWYQREAMRAVNQTLGRVIRHRALGRG